MDITFEIVAPPELARELADDTADGSRRVREAAAGSILESYLEQAADVVTIAIGIQHLVVCITGIARRLIAARDASARQSVSIVIRGVHEDVLLEIDQSSDTESVEQRIRIAVTK